MKKLNTKKARDKKHKRNQLIVGIILVVVMMLSVFGLVATSFGDNGEEESSSMVNYRGLEFFPSGSYWSFYIGEYEFILSHSPLELENKSFETSNQTFNQLNLYMGKPLYLSSEDSFVNGLINQNFGRFIERMQFACYEEEGCAEDFPIKTCEDNFIVIEKANSSSIIQEGNCVFIKGSLEEIPFLIDELTLKTLGVK